MESISSKLGIYLKSSHIEAPKKIKAPPPKLGYIRETPQGETWIVDWTYEACDLHGNHELTRTSEIHPILDLSLVEYDHVESSIIDTETTGLAGGTGTYAFIIGSGFWKGSKFIVRQYLMRDFNEEPAQLTAFAEDLGAGICSYNGKSFDVPLLKSRFRINRLDEPFDGLPHLDMLYPCRRIWKRNLDSFKLTQMEEKVLGYARDGDIPSHLIPSIFFDYLQNRDETMLYPILHHNRDDIVSLYCLGSEANKVVTECLDIGGNNDRLIISVAEMYFRSGLFEDSLKILDKVNSRFLEDELLLEVMRMKGLACKKLGEWEKAAGTFEKMYEIRPDIFSGTEIAKLYEHKLKDSAGALIIVRQIESHLEIEMQKEAKSSLHQQSLTHRKNRLIRKNNRLLQS